MNAPDPIAADVARIVAERVKRAARPKPCRCSLYPFPHRAIDTCDTRARPDTEHFTVYDHYRAIQRARGDPDA